MKTTEATIEDLERELWLRLRNNNKIIWKTRDGKLIPINEMTDSHLINTIKYLEKREEFIELAAEYDAYINDLD